MEATAVTTPQLLFSDERLGEILLKRGNVSPEALSEALKTQSERGGRLGEVLIAQKAITEEDLLKALAEQLDLVILEKIDDRAIPDELITKVPINFAKQYHMVPLGLTDDGTVRVACADPLAVGALDDLTVLLSSPVEMALASSTTVIDAINRAYDRGSAHAAAAMDELARRGSRQLRAGHRGGGRPPGRRRDEAPIIRLVNSLISQSIKEHASDIHIEPAERDLVGALPHRRHPHEKIRPPKRCRPPSSAASRSRRGLNIAEKRLPQDGRIRIKIAGKDIDIRLSTVPTTYGERIAMRLLDQARTCSWTSLTSASRPDQLDDDGPAHRRAATASSWSRDPRAPARPRRSTPRSASHQPARPQHPHHRGSGRVSARRHRPDAGQPED